MKLSDIQFRKIRPEPGECYDLIEKLPDLPISQQDAETLATALIVYCEAVNLNNIAELSYVEWQTAYKTFENTRKLPLYTNRHLFWLVESLHFQIVCHGYQSSTPWGRLKLGIAEWWNRSFLPKLDVIAKTRGHKEEGANVRV